MSKILTGLDPTEYEHDLDKAALNTLERIPGLPKLTKKFYELGFEKLIRIEYTGQYLAINNNNFPKVFDLYLQACKILDFKEIPELYIKFDYSVNAMASGVEKPMIMLHSGAIDLLDDDELLFILGHELGHIKSGHVLYQMLGNMLVPLVSMGVQQFTLGLGGLVTEGISLPLYHWIRMAEFTCDRAGLLCCQKKEAALGVFMKWAGVPIKYQTKDFEKEFINQAIRFQEQDYDSMDKFVKGISQTYSVEYLMQLGQLVPVSHPWTLLRVKKLLEWIDFGKYDEILNVIRCSNCGYQNTNGSKFCANCGAAIK